MSFPEQPFGFVAGRWVRSFGDTPDDADRAPDYVPVETGTVRFTPQVTHRVAPDNTGWAGIIKEHISARLGERGQLIDAEGHDHLALAVGIYSVSYDFGSSRSWPSHYIEVKTTHTVEAPLWLPPIAPPAEGPMIKNRVVTIPADGTDGQVLVWDGAGFSWMDAPEGPQGPPGEVTTAALTTALAGKVTGSGMSVRVDTSVGTRVLLDHPGGTTMLYGDTGWRDMSSYLPPGVTGTFLARRRLHATDVKLNLTLTADSTLIGTGRTQVRNLVSDLPNSLFTSTGGFIAPLLMREGNTGAPTGSVLISYQSPTATRLRITSSRAGNWEVGDRILISGTIPNDQPWPEGLPGTPA